jgi:hypothetical protein
MCQKREDPVHSMKAQRGNREVYLYRWVVNFTAPPLNPSKQPWYVLQRRLCRPQTQPGHFGEEKDLLLLPGFEPQIIQPMA